MKFLLFVIGFCLLNFPGWTQYDTVYIRYDTQLAFDSTNYKTDTLLFNGQMSRAVVGGTTVLPGTANQQYARLFGLDLQQVEFTPCTRERKPHLLPTTIRSIEETDSTLIIDIQLIANCCHSFLCDVEILEDSVINLLYIGYGAEYCACNCCYGIQFIFAVSHDNYSDFNKLRSVMIANDPKTHRALRP